MTSDKKLTEKSKTLSWLLRHGAAEEGLSVDPSGWVPIKQVLDFLKISREDLLYVVEHNNKKRLQLTDTHVRACQGHSSETMPVARDALEESWDVFDADVPLWHGTKLDAINQIAEEGLLPLKRTHVHLASAKDSLVGKRHNTPVLLEISGQLLRKQNIQIFQAPNGVVLVRNVPANCIVNACPVTKKAKDKQAELERMFSGK